MNRGLDNDILEEDLIEEDLDARRMWDASSKECKATFSAHMMDMGVENNERLMKNLRRSALAPLLERIVDDDSLWQIEDHFGNDIRTTRFTGMILDQREFFRIAEQGARKKRYNINIDEFVREMETEVVDSMAYQIPQVRVGGGGVTIPPPIRSENNFRRPFRLQDGFSL